MSVSRRQILRAGVGLGLFSIGGAMPMGVSRLGFAGDGVRAAGGAAVSEKNVLVVVQLTGGNDGLNTVIPFGHDAYHRARPSIGLKDRLHLLGDGLALHPAMIAFKTLFDDGKLAIINGCGYPVPSRSHFDALEIWHTASPARNETCGWLGRCIDHLRSGGEGTLQAVNIGPELPQALTAQTCRAASIPSAGNAAVAMQHLARKPAEEAVARERLATRYGPDAEYPGGLGQDLRLIAQLIAANVDARIFYCQLAGFDTHANQLGQHERLLHNLAASVAAFTEDLRAKKYGDHVMVMCFSEFGRRLGQNSSGGTDHGAAGPMFIVGGKVKGGIYGASPSLADLDDGDLKYTIDFRRVYATVLERWLNVDATAILGHRFEPLRFL